jgi:hypothetical protein
LQVSNFKAKRFPFWIKNFFPSRCVYFYEHAHPSYAHTYYYSKCHWQIGSRTSHLNVCTSVEHAHQSYAHLSTSNVIHKLDLECLICTLKYAKCHSKIGSRMSHLDRYMHFLWNMTNHNMHT